MFFVIPSIAAGARGSLFFKSIINKHNGIFMLKLTIKGEAAAIPLGSHADVTYAATEWRYDYAANV